MISFNEFITDGEDYELVIIVPFDLTKFVGCKLSFQALYLGYKIEIIYPETGVTAEIIEGEVSYFDRYTPISHYIDLIKFGYDKKGLKANIYIKRFSEATPWTGYGVLKSLVVDWVEAP